MYPEQYPFLTRQEFEIAAKSFLEQSKKVADEGWIWIEHEVIANQINLENGQNSILFLIFFL